jgi:hypothetical protein
MLTIQKQRYQGYYTFTIGYEKVIKKYLLDDLRLNETTKVSQHKKLSQEYSPTKQMLKLALPMAAVRIGAHVYDNNRVFLFNLGNNIKNKILTQVTGEHELAYVQRFALNILSYSNSVKEFFKKVIPLENQVQYLMDIIFIYFYLKDINHYVRDEVCTPKIPLTLVKRLNKFGLQKLSYNIQGKSGFLNMFKWLCCDVLFSYFVTLTKYTASSILHKILVNKDTYRILGELIVNKATYKIGLPTVLAAAASFTVAPGVMAGVGAAAAASFLIPTAIGSLTMTQLVSIAISAGLNFTNLMSIFTKSRTKFFSRVNPFEHLRNEQVESDFRYIARDPFLFMNNMFDVMFNIIEKWFTSATRSMVIYGSLLMGTIVMQSIVCKKWMADHLLLEINTEHYNTFLIKAATIANSNIMFQREFEKTINKTQMVFLTFQLNNIEYKNNDDIGNQIHYHFKNFLKIMPENIFLDNVQYIRYEHENALNILPNNSVFNDINDQKQKQKSIKNKNSTDGPPIDLVQILYSQKGKTDYEEKEIVSVDKHIMKYASQFNELYSFNNRKSFLRKYVFNAITNRLLNKPKQLSPQVINVYTIYFISKQQFDIYRILDDKLKPWLKFKQAIVDDDKKQPRYIYVVELKVRKYVENNIDKIIYDLPKELDIIKISRPNNGFKHDMCTEVTILSDIENDVCDIPYKSKYATSMDKKIIEAINKR